MDSLVELCMINRESLERCVIGSGSEEPLLTVSTLQFRGLRVNSSYVGMPMLERDTQYRKEIQSFYPAIPAIFLSK